MPKGKAKKLYDDFGKNIINLILTTTISIGLVGGCSYLLFASKAEEEAQVKFMEATEKDIDETRNSVKVSEISGSGWLAQKSNNAEIMGHLLESIGLYHFTHSTELEASFTIYAIDWCDKSIEKLSYERGEIKGLYIRNQLFAERQKTSIEIHDLLIRNIQQIRSIIKNWGSDTFESRGGKIDALIKSWEENREKFKTREIQTAQIIEDYKAREKTMEKNYKILQDELNLIQQKRYLSYTGIGAGIFTLSFALFTGKNHFFPSRPKPNTNRHKKRRG